MIVTGLDRVLAEPELLAGAGRLGLLYNQASVNRNFRPAADLVHKVLRDRLTTLFGPQHGTDCTEQDNMIETGHGTHPGLGLPVFSLYADSRRPSAELLKSVDTVLVDIQDVGTRVYTFVTTVLYLMEACAEADKALLILDRPNPINGLDLEGNVLDPAYASFVGPFPIPMRHGMTVGELMMMFNSESDIRCRLQVVPMEGWNRNAYYEETGLPWVMPSPNMPLVETATVYPGQVILEGTNLSEGRGTTRPFELFGAPYLEPSRVMQTLEAVALQGALLREVRFRPTFNKWAGEVCHGFQIHVTNRRIFHPYRLSLALLSAILKLYPEEFVWSDPPYEYVHDRLPADVILGDRQVREDLESGSSVTDLEKGWEKALNEFRDLRSRYLLYPG
jgi:uncharacterized protein YbbC (DUF1343 family)